MIAPELVARIRQLYFAEHWRVGTIAEQLSIHADTVRRAIGSAAFNRHRGERPQLITPYLPFLAATLEQYPRLRATRLYEMARARGYPGSVVQLRRAVRRLRPAALSEAYLRLRALPGEEAQVDWARFGRIAIGTAERLLSCFVMVLCFSRALYFEFYLDESLESFLRAHSRAFESFGGVTRTVRHDNLKSAVLARRGELVHFHPRYLELAGHYCFDPRPCGVRRANEKGRVERAVRYLREAFFAARSYRGLDDLNEQARRWREEVAHRRPWPDDPRRTVAEVFTEEQPRLAPLPRHPFAAEAHTTVVARKTIYVRYDGNHYSIPPAAVGRPLELWASDREVRLLDGQREVARHPRSYDRRATIEDPAHKQALLAHKRRALRGVTATWLAQAVPQTETFLDRAFSAGETISAVTHQLETLLTLYGAEALRDAITLALEHRTPRLSSLRYLLEQRRRASRRRPLPTIDLAHRPELQALHVQPHDLEDYDDLHCHADDDDPLP
jgi:transposase